MKNSFAVCTISINDETEKNTETVENYSFSTASKKQDSEESCFFSYSLISVLYCLLALIHTVQERDDLCTGAAAVRAEQAAADTVGNAIVNRPLDRTCVICVRVYISEIAVAGSGIRLAPRGRNVPADCNPAWSARYSVHDNILPCGCHLPQRG